MSICSTDQMHEPVALQSTSELPVSLLSGFAYWLAVIPAVDKDMGVGLRHRFEALDLVNRHHDLALKGYLLLLAD